jgi:hypothetical protein
MSSVGSAAGGEQQQGGEGGEKAGVFQEHRWLTPVTVVVSIVVGFTAMLVLTMVASGGTLY